MADLIFRGVKNPANCSECFFWSICPCLADFDDYSAILDAVHDGNLVRDEECPLLPLPDGYGRLIDADKLYEVAKTRSMGIYGPCNYQCVITGNDILKAPTIVQAEGRNADGKPV